MMRSLFSGVAGLKTHQTRMDVIGNNIANVNTTAYKSQSMTFSDIMYQTTQSSSGASDTRGGVNARQIGLGVQTSAISTAIEQQGASQTTNNPFDVMISGDSFFVVNSGNEQLYTRDGSFYVDGQGNLAMQSNGYLVQGWSAYQDENGAYQIDSNSGIGKLQIMSPDNTYYPAEATTSAVISGNIDQNDTDITSAAGKTMTLEFYDDRGYLYTAKFSIKQMKDENGVPLTTSKIDPDQNVSGDIAKYGDKGTDDEKNEPLYTITLTDILDANNVSIGVERLNGPIAGSDTDLLGGVAFGSGEDYKWTKNNNGKGFDISEMDTAKLTAFKALASDTGSKSLHEIKSNATDEDGHTTILAGIGNVFGMSDAEIDSYGKDATFELSGEDDAITMTIISHGKTSVIRFNPDTGSIEGTNAGPSKELNIQFNNTPPRGLESFKTIGVDLSSITNVNTNKRSTIAATKGDKEGNNTGRMVGTMNGISIEVSGKIWASYSNGQTKLLGQIATANFANASGLEKGGDNLYRQTNNSGDATIQDIESNGGKMNTGVLEMSNVDLSSEFTTMITTQRGFQANSRIITVSDTLLEELTNLKR